MHDMSCENPFSLRIKHASSVLELPSDDSESTLSSLSLGALKTCIARHFRVDFEKLSLICKGRKLQGLAFPDEILLKEALSESIKQNSIVTIQAFGPKDAAWKVLELIEGEIKSVELSGTELDSTICGEWCEKLDNLGSLQGETRDVRKELLGRIETLEKKTLTFKSTIS